MSNKINISSSGRNIIFYIVLSVVMLAVYAQVYQFDFVNIDDNVYVTENNYVRAGLTLDGIRWALTTMYAEFWHPLTWLSLMLDYELCGLNAGGYHLTNLLLHMISALLLFGMFQRTTGAFWPSVFVAAFFALHPLRVESVAWIAERKDVLSVFFWMLTLRFYIHYTEKPAAGRYALALFCFMCGLMSKPLTVSLPVIMILLDYWPLKRFALHRQNVFLLQLKEKLPFFFLSAVFSLITIYAQPKFPIDGWPFSLESRIINAIIAFVVYLKKVFWPYDLAVCYPFYGQAPVWQIVTTVLLVLAVSLACIFLRKRHPYFFVGWFWCLVTMTPVIGIIPAGNNAMADRYLYLPSIGIAILVAWGVRLCVDRGKIRKNFILPAGMTFVALLAVLTWHQCGFWQNSIKLFGHASRVNQENALAQINYGVALANDGKIEEAIHYYHKAMKMIPETTGPIMAYNKMGVAENKLRQLIYVHLGVAYAKQEKFQEAIDYYDKAIGMVPVTPDHVRAYNYRGLVHDKRGQYEKAIEDFNRAVRLDRHDIRAYKNRGLTYAKMGLHQLALENFHIAARMNPLDADVYKNRGISYAGLGQYQNALDDFQRALTLVPGDFRVYYNRGVAYTELRRYREAFEEFNTAIRLKPDYAEAYSYRGAIYLMHGYPEPGCVDVRKACERGRCEILEQAKSKGYCH